jgi:serine/threonine protein kinase
MQITRLFRLLEPWLGVRNSLQDIALGLILTLCVVAPELLGTGDITSTSDIWSVGCLIVELLTGKPPYHGLSQGQILYNLLEENESSRVPLPDEITDVRSF